MRTKEELILEAKKRHKKVRTFYSPNYIPLEPEVINQGKNYADYIKEDIKKGRVSQEEGEWSIMQNRRNHLKLTTKGL